MRASINSYILDGYLKFLEALSPRMKLDLIVRLTESLKSEVKSKEDLFDSSFGAWSEDESAEEIMKGIRESRSINRQIEEL